MQQHNAMPHKNKSSYISSLTVAAATTQTARGGFDRVDHLPESLQMQDGHPKQYYIGITLRLLALYSFTTAASQRHRDTDLSFDTQIRTAWCHCLELNTHTATFAL